jgi:hypothetical protein
VLVDTNTLLRTLQPLHPQREIARGAIKALTARGHELQLVPQNPMEFVGCGDSAGCAKRLGHVDSEGDVRTSGA